MEKELIHFFNKDENKYKEKKELCLELIQTIQKKFDDLQLKKGDKNYTEIDNIVDNISKEVISLKKYKKYKSDFEKVLPSYINLLKENIKYKVFDKIETGCKENGDLFLQPSFTFIPKIENSFDRFKFELWHGYATGIIEVDYTQKQEFKKLSDYLISNLDVSDMLVHIICEYFNRYIKQFNRTKEIFESSKKIFRNEISKTEYFKSLSEKQQNDFYKEIENLKEKIITAKGYDRQALVNYYIECMQKKKGIVSARDLAKGSEYNKDKWNKDILKDYDFIITLNTELNILSKDNKFINQNWFMEVITYWGNELVKAQKRDKNISNKSNAIEYNENIGDD